jgi:hypothetical protein
MDPLPIIDYERMKRLYPDVTSESYSVMTWICVAFIAIGILVLIKRYKDRRFVYNPNVY